MRARWCVCVGRATASVPCSKEETVPRQVFGSHHVDGPVDLDYVQEGQNGVESVSVHLGQAVDTLSEALDLFLERGTTFERAWVVGQ